MASREEIERQIIELQKQLDSAEHTYQVGDEVYTCTGLAVIQNLFTDENGIEKIQCIMKQLDSRFEKELIGSESLTTMPVEHFKKRVALYWSGQDTREDLKKRGITL